MPIITRIGSLFTRLKKRSAETKRAFLNKSILDYIKAFPDDTEQSIQRVKLLLGLNIDETVAIKGLLMLDRDIESHKDRKLLELLLTVSLDIKNETLKQFNNNIEQFLTHITPVDSVSAADDVPALTDYINVMGVEEFDAPDETMDAVKTEEEETMDAVKTEEEVTEIVMNSINNTINPHFNKVGNEIHCNSGLSRRLFFSKALNIVNFPGSNDILNAEQYKTTKTVKGTQKLVKDSSRGYFEPCPPTSQCKNTDLFDIDIKNFNGFDDDLLGNYTKLIALQKTCNKDSKNTQCKECYICGFKLIMKAAFNKNKVENSNSLDCEHFKPCAEYYCSRGTNCKDPPLYVASLINDVNFYQLLIESGWLKINGTSVTSNVPSDYWNIFQTISPNIDIAPFTNIGEIITYNIDDGIKDIVTNHIHINKWCDVLFHIYKYISMTTHPDEYLTSHALCNRIKSQHDWNKTGTNQFARLSEEKFITWVGEEGDGIAHLEKWKNDTDFEAWLNDNYTNQYLEDNSPITKLSNEFTIGQLRIAYNTFKKMDEQATTSTGIQYGIDNSFKKDNIINDLLQILFYNGGKGQPIRSLCKIQNIQEKEIKKFMGKENQSMACYMDNTTKKTATKTQRNYINEMTALSGILKNGVVPNSSIYKCSETFKNTSGKTRKKPIVDASTLYYNMDNMTMPSSDDESINIYLSAWAKLCGNAPNMLTEWLNSRLLSIKIRGLLYNSHFFDYTTTVNAFHYWLTTYGFLKNYKLINPGRIIPGEIEGAVLQSKRAYISEDEASIFNEKLVSQPEPGDMAGGASADSTSADSTIMVNENFDHITDELEILDHDLNTLFDLTQDRIDSYIVNLQNIYTDGTVNQNWTNNFISDVNIIYDSIINNTIDPNVLKYIQNETMDAVILKSLNDNGQFHEELPSKPVEEMEFITADLKEIDEISNFEDIDSALTLYGFQKKRKSKKRKSKMKSKKRKSKMKSKKRKSKKRKSKKRKSKKRKSKKRKSKKRKSKKRKSKKRKSHREYHRSNGLKKQRRKTRLKRISERTKRRKQRSNY